MNSQKYKHQLGLVLFYLLSINAYCLTISNTYSYDFKKSHENVFSLSSSLFAGKLFTQNDTIQSYSYRLRPMRGISLYGGAVDIGNMPKGFSSAPSRPSTIFSSEISVSKEAHLSSGTSTNTNAAGFEFTKENIHALIYRKNSTTASFLLAYEQNSRSFVSFETGALFGYTIHKKKKETVWFIPQGTYPEGRVFVGGGYAIFASKYISGEGTILASTHPFTSYAGCYSGKIASKVLGGTASAEYFRNDRHFMGIDGKTRSLLQKIDYAASFEAATLFPIIDSFLLGIHTYSAQYRQNTIFEGDSFIAGIGYGFKSAHHFIQLNAQRFEHPEATTIKAEICALQQHNLPIGGKVEVTHTTQIKKTKTTEELSVRYELSSKINHISLEISVFDIHKGGSRKNELNTTLSYSIKQWKAQTSFLWEIQAKQKVFSLQIQHFR